MIQPPSALTRAHIVVLLLIVLLGVGMRLYRIDVPLLGIRQNDTAAIARNFAEEEMNIFYPRVDWRGDSPGYVEAELQLYTFAVAWLYRMFGVHEWLGRVLNIGVYAASAWLLFQFGRQVFTARVALFAAFFYSIAPMSYVFTRTFQPDALMSLGALAGVYYFWRWAEDGRPRSWLLSALGVGVAILIKPTNLYFGLPLLYLCYRKFGWRLLRQPSLWLFATATLIPAVVWYAFAWQLWQTYGNTFGILGGWVKVGLQSAGFWLQLGKDELRRVVFQIATPLGVPLLLVGVTRRPPQRNYVLHAWLVGLIVAALIAAEGYFEHNYYLLPFVPVCALWMGYGADRLLFTRRVAPRWVAASVTVLCVLVLVLSAEEVTTGGLSSWNTITDNEMNRITMAEWVNRLTEPDARIIFIRPYRGRPELYQHRTFEGEYLECDPVDFYRSHRKGWSLDERLATPQFVATLHGRGAQYIATAFPEIFEKRPELKLALDTSYVAVEVTPRWTLYRLNNATP